MSLKSSISNSSSNGSNVTRFILDGVVAEMLVEIEDEQEQLVSPSKAFKLNGLEELKASCLRRSFVALDPILKMADIKKSNMDSQKLNKSNSEPDKTDMSSKKSQEDQTSLKSDVLNEQEVSMTEKSDLKEAKESDILDENKESQSTEISEILQKDLSKRNEDQLTMNEVTEISEDKLLDQDKCKSPVEIETKKDEVESQKEGENKSTFEDTIKIQNLSEKVENKSATEEKIEINEGQPLESDEVKSSEDLFETNKDQSSEDIKDVLVVESEKGGNNTVLEGMTETDKAHLLEKDEYVSIKKEIDEIHSSETEEKKVTEIIDNQSSKMNTKSAIDKMTETIVVSCEPTEFEMLNDKALSGIKKSSKLPLKKRKLREPEKTKEEVKEEDEPKSRTLRTRPSEKEKKDVKKIDTKKRKDISDKSTPVPAKKSKIVKEESSKKGIKRNLLDEDKTESVGKRLRSAVQDNSQMQKRSQASSVKSEVKDKKPELRTKKTILKKVKIEVKYIKSKKPETKNTKSNIKSKKPDIKKKKPEIKSKKPVIKSKEIKRQALKKRTLQKPTSAPVSEISSKPKVYNLNPGKVTNLGAFVEIKERVNESDLKYLRYLYRILYDQWPPRDIDELKEEILTFEGYNFNKKSQDLQKREQVLKKMPDTSVIEICKILALKEDSKENMISDIIKFLLKPVKIVISTVDPFDPSMQPVVKLERITIDEYINKTTKKENQTPVPVKRSKRERYPSTKLEIYVSDKAPMSSVKDEQKNSQPEFKSEKNSKGESSKGMPLKQSTVNKTKTAANNTANMNKRALAAKYAKRRKKGFKFTQRKAVHNSDARKKMMKLAVTIQTTKSPTKQSSEVENIDSTITSDSEIILEPTVEEVRGVKELDETEKSGSLKASGRHGKSLVSELIKDISSDATFSSDEAKQVTKTVSPRKRISHIRVGKPLRYFTKIKENILNANFSALQRLHILLFGASDKADNLKGNILAFGGFPFLEGSEEWRQKEFLLSLLAQNTLREYLNLLCIEYTDDDQKALIKKLMKFLAAPSDTPSSTEIRTQVISSEPVNCAPAHLIKAPGKKKKIKKTEEKKKSRTRKVLMDEAQVKRLEADLAREQRIMERERKLHEEQTKKLQAKTISILEKNKKTKTFVIKDGMESDESLEKKAALTAKQNDAELLNALLQTVYKRRALKKAGVMISAPKKETLTRLGELANVKFLVVTANYSDLDVLHHLIYMTEANKAKVRKNILDFAGFNFSEDTQSYKDRMEFLSSLGYDISKRIAFLLGLCPFKTEIEPQDLNELIMYFLMHPCKSKQIPIRHLPQTFFRKDIPKEICQLMQKHLVDLPVTTESPSTSTADSSSEKQPEISVIEEDEPSTSSPFRQRAKKSFKSCLPSVPRKGLSPSISTLPLSAPKPLLKPLKPSKPAILSGSKNKIFQTGLNQSPQPILQKAILKTPVPAPPPAITIPSTPNAPHEVLIQQQTPDGQQKTFKLIKLPTPQAVVQPVQQNTPQQTSLTIPVQNPPVVQSKPITFTQPVQVSPVIGGSLPPGLIFFKGNPAVTVSQSLPNFIPTIPVVLNPSAMNINPIVSVANTSQDTIVAPEEGKTSASVECDYNEDNVEELNPLADSNPPTDEELFNSIQEIIHSSDFENITLKNVIDRVAAQYSSFDLTPRHIYMKECIKKIIMGT